MAEPGKTEKATPKKREDARKKGQVVRSIEVNSLLNVLMALVVLKFFGPYIMTVLKGSAAYFWGNAFSIELTPESTMKEMILIMQKIVMALLPILITVFVVALASNVTQFGFLITFEPLKPNIDKISPIKGLKRMFSKRTLFEFIKAIFKIGVISYILYSSVRKVFNEIFMTPLMDIETYFVFVASIAFKLSMKIIIAFVVFAIIDYLYQRYDYEDNLKMSKQEVKDELKQMEGDPFVKARIRNIQREMARKRMISEIPHADVVITNPTHVAVALRYEEGGTGAPVIVAKGMNLMAEKIKEIARKNSVVIVENPPLARSLVKLEVGWEISPEFFQAVAEILAFVYQAKGKIKLEENGKKVDNSLNNGNLLTNPGGSM